jgi:GNAT superfamily N-acetyltransferase
MSLPSTPKAWTKTTNNQSFLISTDRTLLSINAINAAFASEHMYWARAYPEDILQGIIKNSFCWGLYKLATSSPSPSGTDNPTPEPKGHKYDQIGFARLITDKITFAYLTDVYVIPEFQGLGLGGWILDCVDELLKPLPHLRWFVLRTGDPRSVEAYKGRFGVDVLDNGDLSQGAIFLGRKGGGNLA